MITVTMTKKEYDKMVLCKKIIEMAFENCKVYDCTGDSAIIYVDSFLVEKMFPEESRIAKERAEKKIKEENENVHM